MDDYLSEFSRLQGKYADKIELAIGLEIVYLNKESHPAIPRFQQLPLDYRIGSVHMLYSCLLYTSHHGNSTVELIKEYERCMETEGHPGLEDLLARMDQEKAWEYEQKAKQILSQLKIRNFDQQVKQLSRCV